MKAYLFLSVVLVLPILGGLLAWRLMDHRADRSQSARLLALQPVEPEAFTLAMVENLPEPAKRYFQFSIAQGTPLYTVAKISMRGQFGMGNKDAPNYIPMSATQVLAFPDGFLWEMSGGSGLMTISGSDSAHWTRFWMTGIIPVARTGGSVDHTLSGFGRYASEAIFWTPAAVLPREDVVWTQLDKDTARVIFSHNANHQAVDLTVDEDGKPIHIVLQRWSNANQDGEYRLQPFGGYLSDFRAFEGFQIPTHIEAGNFFGTDAYFPFFIADITDIRFAP